MCCICYLINVHAESIWSPPFIGIMVGLWWDYMWTPGGLQVGSTWTPWTLRYYRCTDTWNPPGVQVESRYTPPKLHGCSLESRQSPGRVHLNLWLSIMTSWMHWTAAAAGSESWLKMKLWLWTMCTKRRLLLASSQVWNRTRSTVMLKNRRENGSADQTNQKVHPQKAWVQRQIRRRGYQRRNVGNVHQLFGKGVPTARKFSPIRILNRHDRLLTRIILILIYTVWTKRKDRETRNSSCHCWQRCPEQALTITSHVVGAIGCKKHTRKSKI